jgi:hypothetical protein
MDRRARKARVEDLPSGGTRYPWRILGIFPVRIPLRGAPAHGALETPKLATMNPELSDAREAFVAAMKRDTPGTDLPRYTAVLDSLLDWSAKRRELLRFRPGGARTDVLRFERAKTKEVLWSAQIVRRDSPNLEIHLAAGRPLSAEDRARTLETLNAHSRDLLEEGDRLRIRFGALKNAAALAAVLALLEQLLADEGASSKGSVS